MMYLSRNVNAGTGALTLYVLPPCRGVVKSVRAVFHQAVAADDTVTVSRGATAVNTLTTGATTAAIAYTGTPDATNKDLVFDPDSSTAANTVIKVEISALASANTLTDIEIGFDEFALTTQ